MSTLPLPPDLIERERKAWNDQFAAHHPKAENMSLADQRELKAAWQAKFDQAIIPPVPARP